ncbi:hypothetical protein NP493_883g00007 [Ridgeia piscesae]|uniref:TGF-beta family profile domain-containing protein n=1 Tax=Ridgeia piscesae TaxID=27915 RepID=A0AAD9KLI4_RIDPI|nr:hypothetical protein NP493_883g00007 [Ridgeia piscesae]
MPQDVEVEDVTSAELWLYKYRSDGLGKQVFVVSEVSRGSSRHGKAAVATTLHERRVTNQRGWVKFNMRSVVRHWMKTTRRDDGVVQVTCRTCRKLRHHRQSAPIEINGENRPIIVINIGARRQRTKRSSSDCRFGCCMEHFYVNFTEIGWNDWIIQPKGYVANHCTGSCTAMSRSNIQPQKSHSAVIYQLDANRREPAITACCAPSRMSSISIIYHNNDGLIVNSQLPDMVVDECKCFF